LQKGTKAHEASFFQGKTIAVTNLLKKLGDMLLQMFVGAKVVGNVVEVFVGTEFEVMHFETKVGRDVVGALCQQLAT